MVELAFHSGDLVTNRRFGGNPHAVFSDARGLDTATMQAIAAEINSSETTLVPSPGNPAHAVFTGSIVL